VGDKAAADRLNSFYIDKVNKLREKTRGAASARTSEWPPASAPFSFTFVRAARVIKTIRGLNSTEALGLDGVPVSVLKKGSEVIGYPLAHVINRSMHTGVFPDGFKSGLIHPVHKGAGKSRAEAASYRPVSILPALSKVLETLVKADLEQHLAEVGGLPPMQYGFRPGRSCATALGAANAGWLSSRRPGGREVVGVMGFDLLAAFDTVDKSSLLPKLEAVGVKGLALK
jgi:hypothetical protein